MDDQATIYRRLIEEPKGGFARLLKNKITPCRNCQWTATGEIKQLCEQHYQDLQRVRRY